MLQMCSSSSVLQHSEHNTLCPLSLSPQALQGHTDTGVTTGPALKEEGKNKPSTETQEQLPEQTGWNSYTYKSLLCQASPAGLPSETRKKERSEQQLPMSVTGTPYSRAEMAVHFPVPFCPALSLIFGRRYLPSLSLNLRILAVISIRKESNSVLFHS